MTALAHPALALPLASLADVSGASAGLAALVGAVLALLATPYLARLSLTVPDKDDARWWAAAVRPTSRRVTATAGVGVVLAALAGLGAGLTALLPAAIALALLGTPLVLIDVEHHRLPDRLVFGAGVAGAALLAVGAGVRGEWSDYLRGVEGGAAVSAAFLLLWFLVPRGFGLGDAKLGAVLGGYLGYVGWFDVYYGIFAGFLIGSVVAVGLLVTGRGGRKTALPFGPALLLGALLVLAMDLSAFGV